MASAEASAPPRLWPPDPGRSLVPILASLALWFGLVLALAVLPALAFDLGPWDTRDSYLYLLVGLAAAYLAFLPLLRLLLGRGAWGWLGGLFRRCALRWYLLGAAAVVLLELVNEPLLRLVAELLGRDFAAWRRGLETQHLPLDWQAGGWALLLPALAVIALLGPLVEELFFRGVLYGRLRRRWAALPAALVCSALFAAVHLDPMTLPTIFLIGLILAWLYERSGSLWPSLFTHLFNNAFFVLQLAFFTW